jgi:uncharacterized BrkB/YihY/UPF0761 family membrane protein
MSETREIIHLLLAIKANQEKPPSFSIGAALCISFAAAVGFVLALALNQALELSFKQIPVGSDGLLGAWIYAVIAIIICGILLWCIFIYLQPFLQSKLDTKLEKYKK